MRTFFCIFSGVIGSGAVLKKRIILLSSSSMEIVTSKIISEEFANFLPHRIRERGASKKLFRLSSVYSFLNLSGDS